MGFSWLVTIVWQCICSILAKGEAMKKIMMILSMLLVCSAIWAQQTARKKGVKTKARSAAVKTDQARTASVAKKDSTVSLISTSVNQARAAQGSLRINDPTINLFNMRAAGAPVREGSTPLPGVPKGTYGFANGRIVFYTNSATSSGTSTGSGSVGTGTSPGTIGTYGPGSGLNGKSPFEATGPYGRRLFMPADTAATKRQ